MLIRAISQTISQFLMVEYCTGWPGHCQLPIWELGDGFGNMRDTYIQLGY